MIPFNIPFLMVAVFLALTLGIAFGYTRKSTSFREYAVGDKQLPTATLVATVLATAYGGGALVRNVELIHNVGLSWIMYMLFTFSDCWIISRLALRMTPFMHHLSMSETIGSIYGKYPRIITYLSNIGQSVVAIAIQINVMSFAITMCMDSIYPKTLTIFAALMVIGYSSIGGIRVVTFTDIVQLGTFCIIIPAFSWWLFVKNGKSIPEIILFLQTQEKFQFSTVLHFNTKTKPVAWIALILSNLFNISPPLMQRVYMSSDHLQASRVFFNAGIASFIMKFFIVLIGVFAFIAAPDLTKTEIWVYIIAHTPPILKGFIAISLLALAMSTADSYLNSCAVMFSHDVLRNTRSKPAIPYSDQLRWAQLTAILVAILAMILSFYCRDFLKLTFLYLDFFAPIAIAPFILAILGFRGSSRTALIGMATGALAILVWNKWIAPTTGINGAFVCMLVNGIAMMAAHYVLPQPADKGWVGPDE